MGPQRELRSYEDLDVVSPKASASSSSDDFDGSDDKSPTVASTKRAAVGEVEASCKRQRLVGSVPSRFRKEIYGMFSCV